MWHPIKLSKSSIDMIFCLQIFIAQLKEKSTRTGAGSYPSHQHWGTKSSVDDLTGSRGVVPSRAAALLRSTETNPFWLEDLSAIKRLFYKRGRTNSFELRESFIVFRWYYSFFHFFYKHIIYILYPKNYHTVSGTNFRKIPARALSVMHSSTVTHPPEGGDTGDMGQADDNKYLRGYIILPGCCRCWHNVMYGARVNGGSNWDSLKVAYKIKTTAPIIVNQCNMSSKKLQQLIFSSLFRFVLNIVIFSN